MRNRCCGTRYHVLVAGETLKIDDPRVLRAIAHPVRMRILDELERHAPLRAADLAEALAIPANQASFHLRQLAKYGLVVEAPEAARDRRDRAWKPVEATIDIDSATMLKTPGGRAIMDVFRTRWVAQVNDHQMRFLF